MRLAALALATSLVACQRASPPPPGAIGPEPTTSSSAGAAPRRADLGARPLPSATAAVAADPPPLLDEPEAVKRALRGRAEACWDDLACPAQEARALTRKAIEAGGLDCGLAYHGVGTGVDLRLTRACLERDAARACREQDTGVTYPPYVIPVRLDRILHISMLLHAQAGPRDVERARSLVRDCYGDSPPRFEDQDTPPDGDHDPCKTVDLGYAGSLACATMDLRGARYASKEAEKTLAVRLDEAGRKRLRASSAAWQRYAAASASRSADEARDGSMAYQLRLTSLLAREEQWQPLVAEAATFRPGPGRKPARRDDAPDSEGDDLRKQLIAAEKKAWNEAREAHIELLVHMYGKGARAAASDRLDLLR